MLAPTSTGVGRIFSRRQKWIFPKVANFFPGGTKSGVISFFPLETTKTTFFAECVKRKMSKFKIQGGARPPAPPSDDHAEVYAAKQSIKRSDSNNEEEAYAEQSVVVRIHS